MKATITKTDGNKAVLKIYKDQYFLKVPRNFSEEDKEKLKQWRKDRITRAENTFTQYPNAKRREENISSQRLAKFY